MAWRITATILSLVVALSAPAVFAHEDASPGDRSWRGATDQLHLSASSHSAIVELLAPKFGIEGLPRGVSARSAIELLDALKIGIEREQGAGRLLVNTGSFLVFLDYALPYVDAGRAAERLGLGPPGVLSAESAIELLDVLKVEIESSITLLDVLKIGIDEAFNKLAAPAPPLSVDTDTFLITLDASLPYVDVGRAAERLGLGPTMTVERTIEFLDVLKVGIEPTPLFRRVSTYVDVDSFLAALDELGIALPSFVDPAATAVATTLGNGRIVWHVGPNVRTEHWSGGLRIHADHVVWPPGAA